MIDENWNAVPTNVRHFEILQPFEYRNFPSVGDFAIMDFDRDLIGPAGGLGWNIDDVYTTLSPDAQAGIDRITTIVAIRLSMFFNFRCSHDFECPK